MPVQKEFWITIYTDFFYREEANLDIKKKHFKTIAIPLAGVSKYVGCTFAVRPCLRLVSWVL